MSERQQGAAPARPSRNVFSGRIALVTGAGRGIGRSVAVQLAEAGAAVLVVARSQSEIDTTAQTIRQAGGAAAAAQADLSDLDGLASPARAASQQFGAVDILVNNAATVQPLGATATLDRTDVAAAVALNVLAPTALTIELLPTMQAAGWGRIINTSSGIVAKPHFMTGVNTYPATKGALEAHTANLAAELAGSGVTAHAYRPGSLDTTRQTSVRHHTADHDATLVDQFRRAFTDHTLTTPDTSAAALPSRLAGGDNGAVWDLNHTPHPTSRPPRPADRHQPHPPSRSTP